MSRTKLIIAAFLCLSSQLFAQPWSPITTTGAVPELKNHSAVYDQIANRMLVFGGRTTTGLSNELWSLNLSTNTWTKITPNNTLPSARYTQNAYFDAALNRMIIWSGQGTELYNDVWAFNIAANSWQLLWPDGNTTGVPLKRYGTASVFDPSTRNIYTHAGFTTSGRFEDTWTFQTDSMKWTDRTNNPHPPKRCLHSACFAYDLGKMIIYGGQDTGPLDDIWSLNINNFSWQNLTPALRPPGRFFYSIIYTGNGNLVVHGGLDTGARSDMWKFSITNNTWESVNQGSGPPAARWGHSAVYIPSSDKMIMFGGEGAASYKDTWQFTNVSVIGIRPVTQNIPGEFRLEQNYPNPFNPTTVIRYQLPVNSFVRLIVYDARGKEVAVIVNQKQFAGTYEVDFDGSGLSSGVYFYSLTVNNSLKATRKMALLK